MAPQTPATAPPRAHASFAALAMHGSDKLRFFQLPEPVMQGPGPSGLRQVIARSWPAGIQAESNHVGSAAYEYKLRGRPFGSHGEAESVGSRVLVRNLLARLHGLGWLADASVSVARDVMSKDTIVLRKEQQQQQQPGEGEEEEEGGEGNVGNAAPRPRWLALGLTGGNRLRFVGGCADGDGDGSMVAALRGELERLGLLAGGQVKMDAGVEGAEPEAGYEFKLQRSMWRAESGERVLAARVLILKVVEVLDSFGWRSYATVRQRQGAESFLKTDTWYFINTQG